MKDKIKEVEKIIDYNFKKLDDVQVKGKSNKVSIYTVER